MAKRCKSASIQSLSGPNPSESSWFITYKAGTRDVFVWKNDERLKLKGGGTKGYLTITQLVDADAGVVLVS